MEKNSSILSYLTYPFEGRVKVPEIPAHGELNLYYDMYALLTTARAEVGGRAMLGDPTDLVGGPGTRLVESSQTPEPATMLLLAVGFVAMGMMRRGRTAR